MFHIAPWGARRNATPVKAIATIQVTTKRSRRFSAKSSAIAVSTSAAQARPTESEGVCKVAESPKNGNNTLKNLVTRS